MTRRGSSGGCMPSSTARSHAPAYHAHETPAADSVSPIVFAVCGGSVCCAGSAKRGSPPFAGGTRDGWYGGCAVFTEYPSLVTSPPARMGAPDSTEVGELGRGLSHPRSSSCGRSAGGAVGSTGVHAKTSHM